MLNLTLEQIFNRTETINYSKTFNYIEQTGIDGTISIHKGAENLKKVPLKIKLHYSYCSPQKIINEIEEKAQNRNIINYYQNGKYIGEYVISDFKIQIKQMIDEVITFAEAEIMLLESPNNSHLSNLSSTNIILKSFLSTSNTIKNFNLNAAKISTLNAFDINSYSQSELLSPTANRTLNKLKNYLIEDIKTKGINNAYDITSKYIDNLNLKNSLSKNEEDIIKKELSKVPKTIVKNSIRQID